MRVAFIGLGIMGSRQAANLVKAGHELHVFNRTRETAEAWAEEHGATVAGSPARPPTAPTPWSRWWSTAPRSRRCCSATTAPPTAPPEDAVHRLHDDRARGRPPYRRDSQDQGHGFVDAPVTGSAPKAEDGTLTIMCGGSDEDMERARPLLEAMGEKIVHAGEVGQGQAVKVISNSVSAINCAALAQALVVGRRADVDLEALLEVMGSGSANSTMLQLKGKPMLEHDFSPLFKLEHMLKDVGLCLDEARANGAPFPFAALARELYSAGVGRGLGEQDFAAVLEVVEGLADTRV
jgi:3-hydroxyisobutyrate dehydrogenase-like beta-hydroxyacid dehydrogenase